MYEKQTSQAHREWLSLGPHGGNQTPETPKTLESSCLVVEMFNVNAAVNSKVLEISSVFYLELAVMRPRFCLGHRVSPSVGVYVIHRTSLPLLWGHHYPCKPLQKPMFSLESVLLS
jgi:hypothetical protein